MPLTLIVVLVVVVVLVMVMRSRATATPASATPSSPQRPFGQASPAGPVAHDVEEQLALLATCVQPRGAGDLSGSVQVRITDHVPADWHFDLSQGSCALVSGSALAPVLTLSATTQTWLDLAAKRLSFAGAAMNGRVQSEGDTAILMRLDSEFSGTPDPSRLPRIDRNLPAAAVANADAMIGTDAVSPIAGMRMLPGSGSALVDALKAASVDPSLTPAQRREAIVVALRQNVGGAGSLAPGQAASVLPLPGSGFSPDVRQAVQNALQALPAGATREEKVAAVRAALLTVPHGTHYAAMIDAYSGGHAGGIGRELMGSMFEGLLEALLGGG